MRKSLHFEQRLRLPGGGFFPQDNEEIFHSALVKPSYNFSLAGRVILCYNQTIPSALVCGRVYSFISPVQLPLHGVLYTLFIGLFRPKRLFYYSGGYLCLSAWPAPGSCST